MGDAERRKQQERDTQAAMDAFLVLGRDEYDFIPCDDFHLLELVETGDTTAGGIVVPLQAQASFERWKVVSVGPGRVTSEGVTIRPRCQPGDIVLVSVKRGTIHPLPVKSPKMILVAENCIVATVVQKSKVIA